MASFATPPQDDGTKPDLEKAGVIYTKKISDTESRVVVTRGDYIEHDLPNILQGSRRPDVKERYYEVRVELRVDVKQTILLASRLRFEYGSQPDRGSVVLDSLVEPRRVVLLMAEGPDLYLWQISVSQGRACWAPLEVNKSWHKVEKSYKLDENLISGKLGRNGDGRLTLQVVEKLSGTINEFQELSQDTLRFELLAQRKVG